MNSQGFFRKTGLIVFALFLFVFADLDIASAAEPDNARDGYFSILYDNSNGLPTSEANAIVQSDDGFIWIGGYSGLIRYDGNAFYRFDSSVGITSVVSLYVDSRERLWIGTNDNGVAFYENGEFRFYGREEGLSSVSIRSIVEDGEGNILIATTKGIAYVDAQNNLNILQDPQISQEYICELKSDSEGTIYGCTLSGAFFSIENRRVTAYFSGTALGFGAVASICPDPDVKGLVYLGTEQSDIICGNMLDNMQGSESISVAPQVQINAISLVNGRLWICADNGIGSMDASGTYRELQNIPMNNSVDDMMVDYEGNLWFVSSRQGVMKVAGSQFLDINKTAGLSSMVVNSTCIYQEQLYIGADTGLYILDENYQQQENELTEFLAGIRIRCIKGDSKGNLWLCTYSENGLVCYHPDGSYVTFNEKSGLKSNRVRCLTELSDGTIAVSVSGGISLLREEQIIATYDEKNGISNTEILSICEGDDGKIYLGSDGDGIYILDDEKVTRLGMDDGLESEVILRIKKDSYRQVYWIITSNSIAYMDAEGIKTISNFPYSNNFDMYFDNAGGIWVLSSNGIYVVKAEELLADQNIEYTFYDMKCGLPSVATANSRSYIDEDGVLYISGTSGVSSVDINNAKESGGMVKLAVPFIEADDRMIALKNGEAVTIPANCKRVTIYGYALTFALENPRVCYYLEGFNEETESVAKQEMQPVSYTNLHGGTYVFHLSAVDSMTGEVENAISITLIKEKAFYECWWFWAVCAVLLVVLILLAVRVYTRYKTAELIRKQEENKTFINQTIHAFAKCIDIKDKYTNGHSFRVAQYASMMAAKMGYSPEEVEEVYNIGLLHDIGKVTVPGEILNKPGKLTEEEYAIIKQHAGNGYDILKEIEISPALALGAGYHHERIDGKGYPSGKRGEEIPMVAQIIAVADTFDAMNSTRPYRKKMKMEDIVEELKRISGTQLNPEIVDMLLKLIEEGAFQGE
jgi:energy-coupling factor transport system substrate-specific component